jgi:lysophospholipase L1-like esterase
MRDSVETKSRKRIVCYGDSNTWGFDPDGQVDVERYQVRYPDDVRWTGVLQSSLGDGYKIIEEGLNARCTIWEDWAWAYRNGLEYIRPCLNSHAPIDMLVLMLGTNDLKPRLCGYVPEIARGVSVLVSTVRQGFDGRDGAPPDILLVSPILIGEHILTGDPDMLNEFGGADVIEKSKQFSEHYRRVADKYGCYFLDAAEYASPGSDALHLNAEGHSRLGKAIASRIEGIYGAKR